jgi:hypothetical protein
MKTLSLLMLVLALAAALAHAASYSRNSSPTSGLWNDSATWTPSGYPQLQGDEADFTLTASVTTQVDDDGRFSTTSVIRASLATAGAAILSRQVAAANSDNLVLLSNVSGYAHIVLLNGTTSSTSPLNLNDTLRVEVAQPVIVSNAYNNSGRPIVLSCDFFGAGDIICQGVGPIRFGFNAGGCEESVYTGTIYVREMSANGKATFYSSVRAFTNSPNAKIVVQNTGVLGVDQANSRCNLPITLQQGSLLTCNSANTANYVTVIGETTFDSSAATGVLTVEGTLSGTGTISRSGNASGAMQFVGTIAPGFSAGTLVLNENVGTLRLGLAGDRVLLNIENGDVISNINMGAAVDLANIDVAFLNLTTPGTTNWFLHADNGFANSFNSTSYGSYVGYLVTEANRIGAVVVPEPVAVCGVALLVVLRRRLAA